MNYTYVLQRTIFGPSTFTDPVTVTVQNGVVTSQVYQQTGQPVEKGQVTDEHHRLRFVLQGFCHWMNVVPGGQPWDGNYPLGC